MRRVSIALIVVLRIVSGCGGRDSEPVRPGETSQAAAARIFARAQSLERENKSKQAFAAYRQSVSHFPETPEAKQAAERIRREQKAAPRKPIAKGPR